MYGITLLFSQFTVRAPVNRFPNFVWITDVVFNLEILKNRVFLFGSHCFPSFETFPIFVSLYLSPLISLTCQGWFLNFFPGINRNLRSVEN